MTCYRYIELNPVRAAMVYAWSSYRCNAEGATDRLVEPHAEYLCRLSVNQCRAKSEVGKGIRDNFTVVKANMK